MSKSGDDEEITVIKKFPSVDLSSMTVPPGYSFNLISGKTIVFDQSRPLTIFNLLFKEDGTIKFKHNNMDYDHHVGMLTRVTLSGDGSLVFEDLA